MELRITKLTEEINALRETADVLKKTMDSEEEYLTYIKVGNQIEEKKEELRQLKKVNRQKGEKMEIYIKTSEWRFHPCGHVYKTEITSLEQLYNLYFSFKEDEGKRYNEVYFKTSNDNYWVGLIEFVYENFSDSLSIDFDKINPLGFEEDGKIRP
jgi:hypothetical protein